MISVVNSFVNAIHNCSQEVPCTKKRYVLVPLDGFLRFNHHSVFLVLLYNMRLEQSFSTEWFQRYTLVKFVPKNYISTNNQTLM